MSHPHNLVLGMVCFPTSVKSTSVLSDLKTKPENKVYVEIRYGNQKVGNAEKRIKKRDKKSLIY